MPYSIEKREDKFCVVKDDTGKTIGCHDTREDANKQMKAVLASENKSYGFKKIKDKFLVGDKEFDTRDDAISHIKSRLSEKANSFGAPTTFDELERQDKAIEEFEHVIEMTSNFVRLIENIVFDAANNNKSSDIRELASEFASRLDNSQEDSEDKSNSLVSKIVNLAKNLVRKDAKSQTNDMLIFKDELGTYRWIARYSNNLRDDDTPQEIISADSHEKFATLVNEGYVPPPKLWLWHEEDWEWGTAEWVSVDKQGDIAFAVAGGYVYPEFNELAEIMAQQGDSINVSHGMPKWSVKRDVEDKNTIVEHITVEVSPLPHWAAANHFTGFATQKAHKETDDMAFSKEEKERLMSQHGISGDLLSMIERRNMMDAQKAATLEIESKDKDEPVDENVRQVDETATTDVSDDVETANGSGGEEANTDNQESNSSDAQQITPDNIVDFMADTNKALSLVGATLAKHAEKQDAILKELREMKEADEQKVAQKAAQSPLASLTSMMVNSVVGDERTRVDGRTSIAKDTPAEAPVNKEITGIPMIDAFLSEENNRR